MNIRMHTVVSSGECCALFEMHFMMSHDVISLGNPAVMHWGLGHCSHSLCFIMNCQCWPLLSYYENSFINCFSTFILSTQYIPGTALDAGEELSIEIHRAVI